MLRDIPNLFSFATKELSQDAVLCWILSHLSAQTLSRESAPGILADKIIEEICAKCKQKISNKKYFLKVHLQKTQTIRADSKNKKTMRIDIVLELLDARDVPLAFIAIEDKISAGESNVNQVTDTLVALKEMYAGMNVPFMAAMIKTGTVFEWERSSLETSGDIAVIGPMELYSLISKTGYKNDCILSEWVRNLQRTSIEPIIEAQAMIANDSPLPKAKDLNQCHAYHAHLFESFVTKAVEALSSQGVPWTSRSRWHDTRNGRELLGEIFQKPWEDLQRADHHDFIVYFRLRWVPDGKMFQEVYCYWVHKKDEPMPKDGQRRLVFSERFRRAKSFLLENANVIEKKWKEPRAHPRPSKILIREVEMGRPILDISTEISKEFAHLSGWVEKIYDELSEAR